MTSDNRIEIRVELPHGAWNGSTPLATQLEEAQKKLEAKVAEINANARK